MVVSDQVDLFAALRPELDSAMLQLAWSGKAAVASTSARCLPWPWAVCGEGDGPAAHALASLLLRPVLWFWLGTPPGWVPASTRAHRGWRPLAEDISACLSRSVGGVRLAPNRGLVGADKRLIRSPILEALIATGDVPLELSSRAVAPLSRMLRRDSLPLRLVRHGRTTLVAQA
ncbi:MAG: hypothetical protein ABR573_08805 [Candidatus Dormibacteria bacterium]